MRKCYILFFVLLFTISLFSQENTRKKYIKYHAFSGTLNIGIDAGITRSKTDYQTSVADVIGRGYLEYFLSTTNSSIFGIRAFVIGGYVTGKDEARSPNEFRTTLTRFGGGISYNISINDVVFPYVFVGLDYGTSIPYDERKKVLNPNPNTGPYNRSYLNYLAEAGIRISIFKSLAVTLSSTAHYLPNDFLDNLVRSGNNDFFYTLQGGVSYALFADFDSDEDGVPDSRDKCPNTPIGVRVDDFGCPVDSDNDGVPDYIDRCPNTPTGLAVDRYGCPIDSDGDGVPDQNDRCPNTPKGIVVNQYGCPDSDNDGVPDDLDRCPGTPQGVPVDNNGCPKDSDGDGVPDYLDKCPNTPYGHQVDSTGCEKADTVVSNVTLSGDTNFETNKSVLLRNAYPVLDNLAQTMLKNPAIRWRIEGYTDNRGSDALNMKLSEARAKAVADYLVSRGVKSENLEIIPMGKTQPVADNKTAEGRAMNRRVEIKAIGK